MAEKAERRNKQQSRISKIPLNPGDLVLLRVPHFSNAEKQEVKKLWHIFFGSYKIKSEVQKNSYELTDPNDETTVKGIYNRKSSRN